MYYPEELVEEIRERNDIVEVIGTYVKLQKKGSSYFGLCPFHNEKSPSFSVSPDKQMYYCFGCGAGGNVFTFIMEYENYSFPEALKYLADRVGIKLPEREYSEEEKRQQDLRMQVLEINKMAANYFYYQLRTESGALAFRRRCAGTAGLHSCAAYLDQCPCACRMAWDFCHFCMEDLPSPSGGAGAAGAYPETDAGAYEKRDPGRAGAFRKT